ncbi:MAG: hypothetical protein CML67_15270 [Rhodobacteraceae bacterium]|nr:hypothetical protein [Paracoccaceae bacterium]
MQRSQLTLNDICAAEEWEAVGPQMPPPYAGEAGPGFSPKNMAFARRASQPPNIPLSMRGHPNQPTMAHRQRRAMNARQRKQAKALAAQWKTPGRFNHSGFSKFLPAPFGAALASPKQAALPAR